MGKKEAPDSKAGIFRYIYDVSIDPDDNVYLLVDRKIIKFNQEGKYLRTYCDSIGEGPGELRTFPWKFFIDSKGNMFVTDLNGFSTAVFNQKGNFVKTIKHSCLKNQFLVLSKTYLYTVARKISHLKINEFMFCRVSETGRKEQVISFPNFKTFSYNRNKVNIGFAHNYLPFVYFCYLKHDQLCYGLNTLKTLVIMDSNNRVIRSIKLDLSQQKTTSDEFKYLKNIFMKLTKGIRYRALHKKYKIPKFRPYYYKLLSDEKNNIYVFLTPDILIKTEYDVVWVYSQTGEHIGKIKLPKKTKTIHRDFAYFVVNNTDLPEVRKYKIH